MPRRRVGNPLDPEILVGPLIDRDAFERMQAALATARNEGGEVFGGERILAAEYPSAFYVRPAIVAMSQQTRIVQEETFRRSSIRCPSAALKTPLPCTTRFRRGSHQAFLRPICGRPSSL